MDMKPLKSQFTYEPDQGVRVFSYFVQYALYNYSFYVFRVTVFLSDSPHLHYYHSLSSINHYSSCRGIVHCVGVFVHIYNRR